MSMSMSVEKIKELRLINESGRLFIKLDLDGYDQCDFEISKISQCFKCGIYGAMANHPSSFNNKDETCLSYDACTVIDIIRIAHWYVENKEKCRKNISDADGFEKFISKAYLHVVPIFELLVKYFDNKKYVTVGSIILSYIVANPNNSIYITVADIFHGFILKFYNSYIEYEWTDYILYNRYRRFKYDVVAMDDVLVAIESSIEYEE